MPPIVAVIVILVSLAAVVLTALTVQAALRPDVPPKDPFDVALDRAGLRPRPPTRSAYSAPARRRPPTV